MAQNRCPSKSYKIGLPFIVTSVISLFKAVQLTAGDY